MDVEIYVSGGTGIAEYTLEDGTTKEVQLGEISNKWLANSAEQYFAKLIGEEVTIEVIDIDDLQDPRNWMSETFTDGY